MIQNRGELSYDLLESELNTSVNAAQQDISVSGYYCYTVWAYIKFIVHTKNSCL